LVAFLRQYGYAVVLLNPYRAAQFRRAEGKKAKTDRIDARSLARFLAIQRSGSAPCADGRLMGLRELTRFRAELLGDRTSAVHRLRGTLDLAFPELLGIMKSLRSATLLRLLAAFPTAAAVARADRDELVGLLCRASQGRVGEAQAAAILSAARTSVAVRQGEAVLALKVRALVRQVVALEQEIAELEAAITREFLDRGFRVERCPCGTPLSLASLIAEAGDVRRFPTAKQFLAHFGRCPADDQRGRYQNPHPRLSKAGNRYVRRLVWMRAIFAVGRPSPDRAYVERRTAAGKRKMHTLVAIGRKLLATVYAILESGQPLDPAHRAVCQPALGQAA
jgi:transposase